MSMSTLGRFAPTDQLHVSLDLCGELLSVGRLALKDRRVLFEYDAAFLSSGFELSPFKLPLKPGVQVQAEPVFDGLFGVFNDSLPDGWGRLLLDRLVERHGVQRGQLSVLDRLAFVGQSGMGALVYEPDYSQAPGDEALLSLDRLAQEAATVLEGSHEDVFEDLFRLNGSSSGARPKVMVQASADRQRLIHGPQALKPGYQHWLIKFASSQDAKDIGPIEYAYSLMARAAGIDMPETHLFKTDKSAGGFFGVQRFDRRGDQRLHLHSLSGLVHADHRVPSLDYDLLLRVALVLTRNVQEAEKAYALACFNVLAHNRDDHAKNFAFLLDESKCWRLAPAYDLTFSYGPGGEQSTMVLGEGKAPGIPHLQTLGKKHGIKNAPAILERVREAVSNWRAFAEQASVCQSSADLIAKALR
jgi:serine/threonine-protein kinase HipA